jgi:hypothetical protein
MENKIQSLYTMFGNIREHMFLCENKTLSNWNSFVPMFPLRITNMGTHMLGMWEQENLSLEHSMFPDNGTKILGKETWGSHVGTHNVLQHGA